MYIYLISQRDVSKTVRFHIVDKKILGYFCYAVIESERISFDVKFVNLDSGNPDLEVLMIFQITYFICFLLKGLFKP